MINKIVILSLLTHDKFYYIKISESLYKNMRREEPIMKKIKNGKVGFTLVELIVVLLITQNILWEELWHMLVDFVL